MAYLAPTYTELKKIVDDYVGDHGYKESFLPPGTQETGDEIRISLDEEDIPGLVSHLSSTLQQKHNNNLYFFDRNVNREFISLKSIIDRMDPASAALFFKAVKLMAAQSLRGTGRDVSV